MSLLPILKLIILFVIPSVKSIENPCFNNDVFNESNSTSIPNEVFKDITISTVEDLIWNITQLDIAIIPNSDYSNKVASVLIYSEEDFCRHYSEYQISLNKSLFTIPEYNAKVDRLLPGCKYTIVFSVDELCTYKYYEIPEQEPCQSFAQEDILVNFPNKVLENISINAFKRNAIRLNISFVPKPEFMNHSGYIVINSKMGRCSHPEEFSFNLDKTNLIVPKAEYPHSFIDSGCEYMIDFEIGPYCVATTYRVPDLCLGKNPKEKIIKIEKEDFDIYKVCWSSGATKINNSLSIIDVSFRIEDAPYDVFNNEMIKENNYNSNYSLLNFSQLPDGKYRLITTFLNSEECSSVSSFNFEVKSSNAIVFKLFTIIFIFFTLFGLSCIFIPTVRVKIVLVFKILFGVTIQVPVGQTFEEKQNSVYQREEINLEYVPLELENCDEFEIPRTRLKIDVDRKPKRGNFGVVYFGNVWGIEKSKEYKRIAVKTLRDDAPSEEIDALLEEINTLKKITSHGNHENVVKMFGCCTVEKPHMLILEFVAGGDLKSYLLNLRNEWCNRKIRNRFIFPDNASTTSFHLPSSRTISETSSNCIPSPTDTESTLLSDDVDETLLSIDSSLSIRKLTPALSNMELQSFASQIANGMAFLESISVVHRDLAARNVLINDRRVLKISDFGMSRIGDYVHRNTRQQPLRWMALESIEQFVCTSKSDVWSFGVVLWEIGTLGAFPYDSISNNCILEYLLYHLKKGIRLMRPEICTDELYSLMLKCWSENPDNRPSFKEIVGYLNGEKKKIYLDFQKLNPAYVFPPT